MNSLYLHISVKPITFEMPKCISINNICIDPDSKNMFWGVLQNLIYANTFPTNQRAFEKTIVHVLHSPLFTERGMIPPPSLPAHSRLLSWQNSAIWILSGCTRDLSTWRKNYSATKIPEEADFCTCLYTLTIELFSKNM